jgi:hypothetical protein
MFTIAVSPSILFDFSEIPLSKGLDAFGETDVGNRIDSISHR